MQQSHPQNCSTRNHTLDLNFNTNCWIECLPLS